jgi:hypothetical protein
VQDQIHLSEQIGKRFGFAAEDALVLQELAIFDRLTLFFQMLERLDKKAAGTAGRVEDHFAEPGVHNFDYEADDGARRVELAGVAGCVAHFLSMDS